MFRYFLNSSILLPESYSASVKSPPTQMKTISNTNSDMSVHWSLVSKHQTITATMNSGQTRLSKQWIIASVVTASGEELQAPPKNAMMARLPTNLSPYKTTVHKLSLVPWLPNYNQPFLDHSYQTSGIDTDDSLLSEVSIDLTLFHTLAQFFNLCWKWNTISNTCDPSLSSSYKPTSFTYVFRKTVGKVLSAPTCYSILQSLASPKEPFPTAITMYLSVARMPTIRIWIDHRQFQHRDTGESQGKCFR
ncbi:hypothetical protein AB4K20DRAFT_1794662 [Rhizopus microsporus]|uniref:Uncharacterized protein n=1 Tax=Rhizopus microsporus TaxID=58291 RepID=A0A1X0RM73_RHIZD|nr:hypothetical protein BCV71DRAFT_239556 [Rhizopus microsporus]